LNDRLRVLVKEPIAEAGIRLLQERFDVDIVGDGPLEERIGKYDAIVIRSATKLTADVLERADRLKVIGRAGVGVDNVDVDAATRRGIVVANAPESTVVSAAEHAVGLLVALARHIPQAHASLKLGRWERGSYGGIELEGKTLGVLGFGRIGQQVARRAVGLGMRVVAHDPFVSRERYRELGVERAESADEVLAEADFLTLHLPLSDETRGAIDAAAFRRMRPGSRLINAARGELVDEEALLEALRSGHRLLRRAVHGPAPRARQRRRHAAPRRLDRGGAGPRRRDRRGTGGRGARGRARHERGEHPGDRARGPRRARALRPPRREARPAGD
jgi:D-3-phosphoglycerate dehydrogenase